MLVLEFHFQTVCPFTIVVWPCLLLFSCQISGKLSSILHFWEPVEQYLPWATLFLTPMTSRILPVFLFSLVIMPFLVNSLVYLMNHYDKTLLKKYRIIAYTFILNLFLVGVNQVTGGNYGLLNATPFIPNAPLWIKYLMVSIILSAALVLFDILFKKRWKKKIALEKIKF